ncbi:MAG: ABC transporter ATP-binding protein [Agathobacter sp.]
MRKLLVYLKDYKKECIFAPLFKLLEASFELIVPLVMAAIIDKGIGGADRGYIFKMGGILVLLALIGLTCSVTAQYFAAKAAVGFSTKLRHSLFAHIETLGFSEMDTVGTSTLITRMTSDINQAQSGVNMALRLFLRSPFIVVGAMVMAFTVNVKAALIFVVTIPLLSFVVLVLMALSVPLYKKVQSGLDAILGHTRENLEGARVIRAFHKEEAQTEQFHASNDFLTNMQMMVGRISTLMNPLTYIIINCATLAIIWTGGKQVYLGVLTQGEVVALVNYMSQILVELIKFANLTVSVNKGIACGNRVQEIFEVKSSMPHEVSEKGNSSLADAENYVKFDHVSMAYQGSGEEALTDISFSVKKGQTIGIIGGTGSGKSSLVNLIPRFYDVSSGRVSVGGRDVRDYDLTALRDKIGVVMQKAVLFAGSIADNLRWGNGDATEEQLWQALEVAQAKDVVEKKEGGLAFMIEQGGRNLSGGQKQRLTIARAVVKDPDILILDDSASALDFATDAKLRAALRGLQGEKTIFIVSQRTSSIQFADQILVMDDGRLVGIGTHEQLLDHCEIYREIYDSQFKKEDGQKGGEA